MGREKKGEREREGNRGKTDRYNRNGGGRTVDDLHSKSWKLKQTEERRRSGGNQDDNVLLRREFLGRLLLSRLPLLLLLGLFCSCQPVNHASRASSCSPDLPLLPFPRRLLFGYPGVWASVNPSNMKPTRYPPPGAR